VEKVKTKQQPPKTDDVGHRVVMIIRRRPPFSPRLGIPYSRSPLRSCPTLRFELPEPPLHPTFVDGQATLADSRLTPTPAHSFAQQKTTVGTSGAAAKELPPALGAATPVQPSTTEKEGEGYSLPASQSQKETEAGTPSNNNASVEAQQTAAQATSSAPAGTAAAKPKKKSGGFFASCCGKGNAIE
jgi:hypothetical protein